MKYTLLAYTIVLIVLFNLVLVDNAFSKRLVGRELHMIGQSINQLGYDCRQALDGYDDDMVVHVFCRTKRGDTANYTAPKNDLRQRKTKPKVLDILS